jgi:hypothetical protein
MKREGQLSKTEQNTEKNLVNRYPKKTEVKIFNETKTLQTCKIIREKFPPLSVDWISTCEGHIAHHFKRSCKFMLGSRKKAST